MAAKKQRIEGGDPVVVSDEQADSDSDSDSYMDLEPRSGDEPCTSSEGETREELAQQSKEQTAWTAEEALKYYNKLHQGVEYVLVDPLCSNAVFAPCGAFCHSLFKAKKVVPSPSSGSGSSVGSSCPATANIVIDGSSSIPVETSPPTPEVAVSSDSGSSSSSSTLGLNPTPSPTPVELFFAETAMYSGKGMNLTVLCCAIIDTSGRVPAKKGCFYCSSSTKQPFYHPPEEQLEFGKHNCDKGFKYDDEDMTSSDDEPEVPCMVPPHRRSTKI